MSDPIDLEAYRKKKQENEDKILGKYLKLGTDSELNYSKLHEEKSKDLIKDWHKYNNEDAETASLLLLGRHRTELSDIVFATMGEKKNFAHLEGQKKRIEVEKFVDEIGKFALFKYYHSKTGDEEKTNQILKTIMEDEELFRSILDQRIFAGIRHGNSMGRMALVYKIEENYSDPNSNLRDFLHEDTPAWRDIYRFIAHGLDPVQAKSRLVYHELNQVYRREDVHDHAKDVTGLEYKTHVSAGEMLQDTKLFKRLGRLPHEHLYSNRENYTNLPDEYMKKKPEEKKVVDYEKVA